MSLCHSNRGKLHWLMMPNSGKKSNREGRIDSAIERERVCMVLMCFFPLATNVTNLLCTIQFRFKAI